LNYRRRNVISRQRPFASPKPQATSSFRHRELCLVAPRLQMRSRVLVPLQKPPGAKSFRLKCAKKSEWVSLDNPQEFL
jgi:hypothetical protein